LRLYRVSACESSFRHASSSSVVEPRVLLIHLLSLMVRGVSNDQVILFQQGYALHQALGPVVALVILVDRSAFASQKKVQETEWPPPFTQNMSFYFPDSHSSKFSRGSRSTQWCSHHFCLFSLISRHQSKASCCFSPMSHVSQTGLKTT
jgi:hypothetical protein